MSENVKSWAERYPGGSVSLAASAYEDGVGAFVLATAREALKPIRELHWKRTGRAIGFGEMPDEEFCNECSNVGKHVIWPCSTAKLVYTEAELDD